MKQKNLFTDQQRINKMNNYKSGQTKSNASPEFEKPLEKFSLIIHHYTNTHTILSLSVLNLLAAIISCCSVHWLFKKRKLSLSKHAPFKRTLKYTHVSAHSLIHTHIHTYASKMLSRFENENKKKRLSFFG